MHPETGLGPETCAYAPPILVRRAVLALLATAVSACGSGDTVTDARVQAPTPSAVAGEQIPLGCEPAVPATRVPTPRGLIIPDGIRVIAESTRKRPDDDRITVVEGYVERVPSQLVKEFKAAEDIEIQLSEDEEFEAELLVSDGRYRAFWKVVRVCLAASKFTALYSSERTGDAVAGAAPATKTPVPR